jgi:Gpi18-like mannosyltransferase
MDTLDPRAPAKRSALIPPALWAAVAFLVSRLLMLAVGWEAVSRSGVRVIGKGMYDHRHGVWHGLVPQRLFDPWANWDGQWFIRIASNGYHLVHSEAFFPLYPLIVRYVGYVTGNYVLAGTIVSWVAIALALWLLYRMVAARFDPAVAAWTVAFLSFFPTSFYLTSVYSESLFLLFSVAAFYFAERKHWALAGVAGMLSVLTRNTGLFLVIPLALLMV